jgi:putative hemolysin
MVILEIILVLALFVLNGFFAMAELAIVTSRRAHLERLAKEGRPGAQIALTLADDPARVLATVQIGVTTSASLAGIVSGATLADQLAEAFLVVPGLTYGKPLAIAIVTVGVAYVALVIGELAPKHIGLNNPETIAIRIARPLAAFARAAAPAIWLLNGSTRLLLRLVNLRPRFERALTEDDIHYLVAEGARLGVIHNVERDMIEGVLCRQPGAHDHDPAPGRALGRPRQSQRSDPQAHPDLRARSTAGLPRFDR